MFLIINQKGVPVKDPVQRNANKNAQVQGMAAPVARQDKLIEERLLTAASVSGSRNKMER